jgi:hypothetical protein
MIRCVSGFALPLGWNLACIQIVRFDNPVKIYAELFPSNRGAL